MDGMKSQNRDIDRQPWSIQEKDKKKPPKKGRVMPEYTNK